MSARPANDEYSEYTDPVRREEILRELWEQKGREAVRGALLRESVDRLSKTDPSDIQGIAAGQIQLLNEYHNLALGQARRSFNWALVAAAVGLGFFLAAVGVLLLSRPQEIAVVGVISGAIVEAISGIKFYLYGKASDQLAEFQGRLDRTQRFLLANSVCSALEGELRDQTRAELVRAIAGASSLDGEGDDAEVEAEAEE